MLIEELLANYIGVKNGDFNDLTAFNFVGVYVIFEKWTKEVVYIGSAYARNINKRLNQYLCPTDTGNTLGKTIAKTLAGSKTYDANAKLQITNAVSMIKNDFAIIAISHEDLEYKLIKDINPAYNNTGRAED